jgi:hypothetical protein
MELPEPLLSAVKQQFDSHHPFWHLARVREAEIKKPEHKTAWKKARKMFPALKFRDEPGAGAEFLTFHREMMREYKWLLEQLPEANVVYEPWPTIRDDVRVFIENTYHLSVADGLNGVSDLSVSGTLSDVGGYIEPSPDNNAESGAGLHDASHGAVSAIEKVQGLASEFSMGSPSTAHRNIIFYQLHGWIDERYAAWQRAHGETPDLSPKEPTGMHGAHAMVHTAPDLEILNNAIDAVDTLLRFDRRWLK